MNGARHLSCLSLVASCVLGIPVFLAQALFLRHETTVIRVDVAMGVVAFSFSMVESILSIVLVLQASTRSDPWHRAALCLAPVVSIGVLLFSIIYDPS